jgi:hypothetical protein
MTDRFDPLETSALIVAGYRRYLRSLLPVRDPRIATALIAERVLSAAFRELGSDTLPFGRPLYKHQEQAIRKVAAGRNVVVAAGTGSGKTESLTIPTPEAMVPGPCLAVAKLRRPVQASLPRTGNVPAGDPPGVTRRTSVSPGSRAGAATWRGGAASASSSTRSAGSVPW